MKGYLRIGIFLVLGMLAVWAIFSWMSYSNQEHVLRNRFMQKTDERTAFYDNMWKTISQKGQIAIRNDSSFRQNINIIMAGRKDAQGVFWKWVQETNPNANYEQVSILYQDLSRAVEAKRDEFFVREKEMQSIKLEHDNLLSVLPGSMFLSGRDHLIYKPITSDRTDNVIKTGKDNDVGVF